MEEEILGSGAESAVLRGRKMFTTGRRREMRREQQRGKGNDGKREETDLR
jgi:hypothetical protein